MFLFPGVLAALAAVVLLIMLERSNRDGSVIKTKDVVAALGVVFGDIGTSILYTFNETFFHVVEGHVHGKLTVDTGNVLGVVSLIFWSLTIVMCFKYAGYVLRVTHHHEGGPFALAGVLGPFAKKYAFVGVMTSVMLVISACLLVGEGLITPPISCLAAVEGLVVLNPSLAAWVVPIVLAIFVALFSAQRFGTHKVGTLFGYTTLVWFLTVGAVGAILIAKNTEILKAMDPTYALMFLGNHGFKGSIYVLGSVVLCMTGGEALYADIGHFGRGPIVRAWYRLVFPALLLNYFGQGAFLLGGGEVVNGNVFYSSANSVIPAAMQIPLIILATFATIIASQALISGVFSLVSIARSQDFVPPHLVKNTSHEMRGQIYIPSANWMLFAGCCALVLIFQSSTNLAAAYGLAVTGVMLNTTVSMFLVAVLVWKWKLWMAIPVFAVFLVVDISYFTANAVKFLSGGYVPFSIGCVLFFFLKNRKFIRERYIGPAVVNFSAKSMGALLELMKAEPEVLRAKGFVRGLRSVEVLVSRPIEGMDSPVPAPLLGFITQERIIPDHIVLVHVSITDSPYEENHFSTIEGENGLRFMSVRYGFMERPDLANVSDVIQLEHGIQDPLILVGDEELIIGKGMSAWEAFNIRFYRIVHRNTRQVYQFLYPEGGVGLEARINKIHLPVLIHRNNNGRIVSEVMLQPNLPSVGQNGRLPVIATVQQAVGAQ